MINGMKSATYYTTNYAGKLQGHSRELWHLLYEGQRRLEQTSLPTDANDPTAAAQRCFMRMATSCDKQKHKSFQEMIALLLREPEAICSHAFRRLYFTNALLSLQNALHVHLLVGDRAPEPTYAALWQPRLSESGDESVPPVCFGDVWVAGSFRGECRGWLENL